MRLTINGEQVSYSLENERTLGEVVRGVQAWLADAGFLITGMRAAGELRSRSAGSAADARGGLGRDMPWGRCGSWRCRQLTQES